MEPPQTKRRACSALLILSVGMQTMAPQAREPSSLKVAQVNGAPGWLLDAEPYVPVLAQAGRAGSTEVRSGRLHLGNGTRTVRLPRRTTAVDALSGQAQATNATEFDIDMEYGETRVWAMQ